MTAKDLTLGHFRTLGLHCNASDSEIQDAYYRLVRAHHPDRNQGDPDAEARFKKVQFAYETLSKREFVEPPQQCAQFPFIKPDAPPFAVRWWWLAASTAAVAILVTLIGLSRNTIQIAAVPPTDSANLQQALRSSRSSAALTKPAQPSTANDVDLGRSTVADERLTERILQRNWNAKTAAATSTVETRANNKPG